MPYSKQINLPGGEYIKITQQTIGVWLTESSVHDPNDSAVVSAGLDVIEALLLRFAQEGLLTERVFIDDIVEEVITQLYEEYS